MAQPAAVAPFCRAVHPSNIRSVDTFERSWFDPAQQAFLLLKNGTFSVWSPNTNDEKSGIPLPFYHDHLNLPQNILLAKISLDLQLVAAQISVNRIMVFDITNHNRWTIDIKSPSDNRILPDGMVWSEHSGNSQDLVIVTVKGLEMYKVSSIRNQCKLSRTISQGVSYHSDFWYEPNHRMMLLTSPLKSGADDLSVTGRGRKPSTANAPTLNTAFPSSSSSANGSNDLLALNGYFFRSEKSDFLPKLELPAPEKTPRFELGPGVSHQDVSLVTLYGNLYCCVSYTYDYSGYIALYLITKTAVTRTHTLSQQTHPSAGPNAGIGGAHLHVITSVADNLLFAHCLQSQTTLIFDILHRSASGSHAIVDHIDPVAGASAIEIEVANTRATVSPPSSSGSLALSSSSPLTPPRTSAADEEAGWAVVGDNGGTPQMVHRSADLPHLPPSTPLSSPAPTSANANVYDANTFTFLAPLWLWNPQSGTLRRIRANLPAIAQAMHDHRQCISFLSRRGQVIRAPRPVYSSYVEGDESLIAKQLILQRCSAVLLARAGLSWLEVVFKVVGTPYANECARINAARQSAAGPYREPKERERRSSSTSSSSSSSGSGSSGSVAKKGLMGIGFGSSRHRDSFDKPVELDYDNVVARGLSVFTTVVSDARESLAVYYSSLASGSQPDVEPLEPTHLLYTLLPDITTIGRRGTAQPSRHGTTIGSPYGSSSALPLVLRRDHEGNLVVTQGELLSHVWIPAVLQASDEASVEYHSWALSSYVAVQRGIGATVHPAVSLLLLKLLAARGRYMEAARLLQLQFFPDASEVAMTALEISDVVEDLLAGGGGTGSLVSSSPSSGPTGSKSTCVTSTACSTSPSLSPSPRSARGNTTSTLVLKSAVSLLQQVGLDMLWRLQERPVAVRWLLGHGRVTEAIAMCRKKRGQWRANLAPGSVAGIDFFQSALTAVQATVDVDADADNDGDESDEGLARDEYLVPPGERVELLHTVYRFLKEWDPAVLAPEVASAQGQSSRLALQCAFPEHMYSPHDVELFRALFGYV